MLFVLDDFARPLGRLLIRTSGSSGGHNGLESIFQHFSTLSVPRMRIGIGAAPVEGAVDYVLGKFFEEEKKQLDETLVRAAAAVKFAIDTGVIAAINEFNKNQRI